MILQKKLNEKENIERYKERLVEHGFRQRPEIDFHKTSTLLVTVVGIHLTLSVLRSHMTMKQLNVTTAFLEGRVKDELYGTLPKDVVPFEGYLRVGSDSQIGASLIKGLYGLMQVSLIWFEIFGKLISSLLLL